MQLKTAVVTAGAKGIGEAIVRRLAGEGYSVVFSYRNSGEQAKKLAGELRNVFSFRADLSVESDCVSLASFALRTLGHIDVLVCNAGSACYELMPHTSPELFDTVVSDNLKTTFLTCKAFYDSFVSQKKGSIINVSSIWGIKGGSCESAYSAAKAGVIGLTTSLAEELAPSGVRVNSVAPGAIETDMLSGFSAEEKREIISGIPLKRIGSPAEIASVVSFLAGEDSSYVTGQVINVSGGFLI